MTLCIGALSKNPLGSPCIVLLSDTKLANDYLGSETQYKFLVLSNQFTALYAGLPGRAKELERIYEAHLKGKTLTEENFLEILREPPSILKARIADAHTRKHFGFSYTELRDHGAQWLGEKMATKHLEAIESMDTEVDLIIAGFIGGKPIICELQDGELEEVTNFSLIGTGKRAAEPPLHMRKQMPGTELSETIYNCYEAKKFGESSPFVGKETRIIILDAPNENSKGNIRARVLTPDGEACMATLFEQYGPKQMRKSPLLSDAAIEKGFFNFNEGY